MSELLSFKSTSKWPLITQKISMMKLSFFEKPSQGTKMRSSILMTHFRQKYPSACSRPKGPFKPRNEPDGDDKQRLWNYELTKMHTFFNLHYSQPLPSKIFSFTVRFIYSSKWFWAHFHKSITCLNLRSKVLATKSYWHLAAHLALC